MKKRKQRLTRKASKKMFRNRAAVHPKNSPRSMMRGGYRL